MAAILCHEYRHSRQNLAQVVTYALSFVFAKDGDSSIVENDAVLYERQETVAFSAAMRRRTDDSFAGGARRPESFEQVDQSGSHALRNEGP